MSGIHMMLLGPGGSAPVVSISNQTVQDIGIANPAIAGYSLTNGGDVQTIVGVSPTTVGQWISPASGFSGYEARVSVVSGSSGTLTGTTGTWLNLGTTRTWDLTSFTSSLFCDRVLTVEIRDAGTLTVLTSATITLQVEAT
jgi:hypothetical protein